MLCSIRLLPTAFSGWGLSSLLLATTLLVCPTVSADVISGTLQDWEASGLGLTIGDGVHHVTMRWTEHSADRGWFYGSNSTGDSDLWYLLGITNVAEITDAESLFYSAQAVGPVPDVDADPLNYGGMVIYRHLTTGHFGVLRVEDIHGPSGSLLNGTWWFQTDGSGDFSPPDMLRGDCNQDGSVNVADAITVLTYLFTIGSSLACVAAADVNDDNEVDIGDPIFLLVHLFGASLTIPPPSQACGPDPTSAGRLDCDTFACP